MKEHKTYKVRVKGVSDLLMNKLDRELIKEIKTVPRKELDEWEDTNWKRKMYLDGENIVLPTENIHACLCQAARKYKVPPPQKVGRTWTDYVKSTVLILDHAIVENATITPFKRMVNGNPSSMKKSSKVYKVRPRIDIGWTATFSMIDSQGAMDAETIKELLTVAGHFVGIGDWRPMHGRFDVVSVKEA